MVCLGTALAAAAIAPLAMLRAAPSKPPQSETEQAKPPQAATEQIKPPQAADEQAEPADDQPPADKRAQRDPTPEEIEARASGIRISVLNAKGDRGIPEFRVIAGVSSGSVAGEFEKRTGKVVINWQPHTCRIGKEGDYVWPLAKAYDEMALRVEADNYQPQVMTGIKKANGPQHIVFLLAEDKGVSGRVLTPAGKPAEGATVALALPHKEIVWEAGKLRGADNPLPESASDRWQQPLFVKTDAAGAFRLPTEIEPAAVLVIHDSGVLEIAYDAWQRSPELTLQRWGSIAGQVLWHDKPGTDENVSLTIFRDEYGYPGMIASYAKTPPTRMGDSRSTTCCPARCRLRGRSNWPTPPTLARSSSTACFNTLRWLRASRRVCCWAVRGVELPENSSAWIPGKGQRTTSIPRHRTSDLAATTRRGKPSAKSSRARSARSYFAISSPSTRTARSPSIICCRVAINSSSRPRDSKTMRLPRKSKSSPKCRTKSPLPSIWEKLPR